MKNIHSCLIILAFFTASLFGFVSCNSDTDFNKPMEHKDVSSRITTALPSNASNPYDEAGWFYTELFDTYFTNGDLGGSVSQIASKVQSIANANSRFNAIKSTSYHAIDTVQVNYIRPSNYSCI